MEVIILPLKEFQGYFISSQGYCFKTLNGKDIELEVVISRRKPFVKINHRKYSLLNMMVDHFIETVNQYDKISFQMTGNRLPLSKIKLNKYHDLKTHEQRVIFQYLCDSKAHSQNKRAGYKDNITPVDILNALQRTGFKCFYCNDPIKPRDWHIDHVVPLSNGGKNIPTNITPACKYCNMMKGVMDIPQFLKRCRKIVTHSVVDDDIILDPIDISLAVSI